MSKSIRTTSVLLVLIVVAVAAVTANAADPYELRLASRSYVPEKVRLAREYDSHLIIQFYDIPTESERAALAEAGVTLLDYIPNYAWTASVRGGAIQALAPDAVRAVFELQPADKVRRTATGQDVVRAFVYGDVVDAGELLGRYGTVLDRDLTSYTIALDGDVMELAAEDIVSCVMGPRPEKALHLDELRDNIDANEVQTSPYDLHGNGLYAGIWDGGAAATNHDDYSSRLTVADGSSTHYHATMCTGIMAGDGTRSASQGGSAYQWRGVATEVDIASYDWPYDVSDMDDEASEAIATYDIIVASNSWGWGLCPDYCEYYAEYDDWSQNYDKLVRGGAGKKLTYVFSAGNDGDCTSCAGDIPNYPYGTIPGPGSTAKNTIVVGSNDADDDGLSSYSSMGPTLDGRLKPDIVAPGCKSYEGINTTYLYNNYSGGSCGTSFSCPAVSGSVVLAQEDFIDKFGDEAWPSTMKALLIQGAEDQGNSGPDYQFGYGRLNIQNTIDIIRDDDGTGELIKEDTLSPSETWEYEIEVTSGEDLKVTLAWDDYEGDYSVGGVMLVNDLDLELECSTGTIFRPWVLDPNHPSNTASRGYDHLNNVEQVTVSSPDTGTWTIRVTATVMPEPDQDFSVVTNFAGGAEDPPPAAPTGLDADPGSGEGEIDVSWNANSEPDLDHYRLERDDNPSFSSPASFVVYGTTYDDSGLTPGDTYHYRVFAVDAGSNESGASSSDSAAATDLAPDAPTGLDADPGSGEGEIDVSWNANSEPDLDHYRLERDDNPSFSSPASFVVYGTTYDDSGLTPGDTYHYRVFAVDAGSNESGASSSDSAAATDLAPAAPTGLDAVTGSLEGEIDVSWSASPEPDFDRYRLERSLAPDFEPGSEPFEGAVASYTDTGLIPGELYYYRVYAIDANDNVSEPSDVDSAVALDLAPATPAGLSVVPGVEEGTMDVSWDANSETDFDHYRLERDTDSGFGPGSDPFDTPATYFPDSGLVPGDEYFYRVIAVDANGNESAPSDCESALATDHPPAQPTGVTASSGTGEGEIDVTWVPNAEPDFDHYVLERDTDAGFPAPDQFTTTDTSWADSGLTPGLVYHYRVTAVDDNSNESLPSDSDSATATDLPPGAPTGLAAVPGASEGDVDVSWDANPELDLDGYVLERDTDPGFGSPVSVEVSGTTYTDPGLTVGLLYHYRVSAVDVGGNSSDPSVPASSYPLDLPPGAPTGLLAATGSAEGEIDLSWSPNPEPDVDHYKLERDMTGAFTSPTFIDDIPGMSHTDTGLIPGETYYYRVYAVDGGEGTSNPSGVGSADALDLPPAAPTGLAAVEGLEEGEVEVSWDANSESDLDHYRVERDTSALFGPDTESVDEGGTSLLDSGLEADTYYYRVFAVDANGLESDASDTVSITLEQTGVEQGLVAGVAFIRPNPFTTQATLQYTVPVDGADVTISLYDIRGRRVRTLVDRRHPGGSYETVWNGRDATGRNVSSGVYFASVSIGEWSETRKIAYVR